MKQKSILFSLLTSKPSLGFRVWSLGLRVHGVISFVFMPLLRIRRFTGSFGRLL